MNSLAILTYDNVSLFELGCATELFALPRPEFDQWYQTEIVTFQSKPLNTTGGITLNTKRVKSLRKYDTLIIPCWSPSETRIPQALKAEVLALHRRGGRIISFCSGAFFVAETGLLDGCDATTHWVYAEQFKKKYPQINYLDDVLYIYDGVIGSSAGSAAALDLGLQVIRQDYGHKICNQVARRMVMSPHRDGGQSQFVETPVTHRPDHFALTLDWAIKNLIKPIDVTSLAVKANMSRRTFDRKFRASLNMTPKEWLIQQRLHLAKSLLETSREPIEIIAQNSGFDNPLTLRHNFRKYLKLSPSQYRKQFGI